MGEVRGLIEEIVDDILKRHRNDRIRVEVDISDRLADLILTDQRAIAGRLQRDVAHINAACDQLERLVARLNDA